MHNKIFILFLFIAAPLLAEQKNSLPQEVKVEETADDLQKLDLLITITQENIEKQKKLRQLLINYREVEQSCIQNSNDPKLLLQLVSSAKKLHDGIDECYLHDYFRHEFLEELKKLTKLAEKKNIPSL